MRLKYLLPILFLQFIAVTAQDIKPEDNSPEGCFMDVCGENAVCITTQTGYECLCPEGSVGNPDMRCYFKI
ncbi:hypothetical protein ACKWTF_013460 [Chironomus riparius]